jgi:hypothetical protein
LALDNDSDEYEYDAGDSISNDTTNGVALRSLLAITTLQYMLSRTVEVNVNNTVKGKNTNICASCAGYQDVGPHVVAKRESHHKVNGDLPEDMA